MFKRKLYRIENLSKLSNIVSVNIFAHFFLRILLLWRSDWITMPKIVSYLILHSDKSMNLANNKKKNEIKKKSQVCDNFFFFTRSTFILANIGLSQCMNEFNTRFCITCIFFYFILVSVHMCFFSVFLLVSLTFGCIDGRRLIIWKMKYYIESELISLFYKNF